MEVFDLIYSIMRIKQGGMGISVEHLGGLPAHDLHDCLRSNVFINSQCGCHCMPAGVWFKLSRTSNFQTMIIMVIKGMLLDTDDGLMRFGADPLTDIHKNRNQTVWDNYRCFTADIVF